MDFPHGETVQVLDGSGANGKYGAPDWTWPVKGTYERCAVWPADANATAANETSFQRDTVEIGLVVALPVDADVHATDRIRARGADWDVVGEPQPLISPFTGWAPGMPVTLRRVTG